MTPIRILIPAVLAIALGVWLLGPIGPVPGAFIGGTSAEAPAEWPETEDVDEIRLKVPGFLPRVVIIWVIDFGGELHVVGSRESGWVEIIGDGSPVEMRLGDRTYVLTAVPVAPESPLFLPILEAYVAKYEADYPDIVAGFPTMEEAPDAVAVFRLDRR